MKKFLKYFLVIFILATLFVVFVNLYVISFSNGKILNNPNSINNSYYVGLVFGASVKGNNDPSDILKHRLKTAFNAYKDGKINKIIVSGDNSIENYNEPVVMQKYLIGLGVSQDDIYLDYAGFDTFDSLYRARDIFGINKLVLFTQEFHLKRALYISEKLGIDSIGIISDLDNYLGINYFEFREIFSRVKAFFEIEIISSKPKFLGEKIEID